MTWIQVIGLIAAILMGVYNAVKGFETEKEVRRLETPQAIESVYEVEPGSPPPTETPQAMEWVYEVEPGSPPPTDPGKP